MLDASFNEEKKAFDEFDADLAELNMFFFFRIVFRLFGLGRGMRSAECQLYSFCTINVTLWLFTVFMCYLYVFILNTDQAFIQ